uniref:Uncharacterized protein n=1 Tax=Panagrolaimus superbus TaxID=310955 RepID=A0A914YEJ7_9BILA
MSKNSPSFTPSSRISMFADLTFAISSLQASTNQSIDQKVYLLERELEIIKVKQACFGRVSLKEIDQFIQKVKNVKNEYIASKL